MLPVAGAAADIAVSYLDGGSPGAAVFLGVMAAGRLFSPLPASSESAHALMFDDLLSGGN